MILVPDCDKKSAIILANKLACAIADTRVPMGISSRRLQSR